MSSWQQGRMEEGRLSCLTPEFPAVHPKNGKTIFLGHVVGPSYRRSTPTPFMLHKTSPDIIERSSRWRSKTVCQIVRALDVGRRMTDGDKKINDRRVSLATHRCPSMESGNGWRAAKDGEHTILDDGWQITTSDHSVQGGRR